MIMWNEGFGPATGPTLKTALCHIRALVGRIDKCQRERERERERERTIQQTLIDCFNRMQGKKKEG